MFTPITDSMAERRKLMQESLSKEIVQRELKKCESLEDFYWLAKRTMNGTLAQMQLYILDNYKKVPLEEWNRNSYKIVPHLGKDRLYFGKEDQFVASWRTSSMQRLEKERYDESIRIESISFVLDPHDGDFSVDFNDGTWTFLWGEEIFKYYMDIKTYLEKQ